MASKYAVRKFVRVLPDGKWQELRPVADLFDSFVKRYVSAFLEDASEHLLQNPSYELKYEYCWDNAPMVELCVRQEHINGKARRLLVIGSAIRISRG